MLKSLFVLALLLPSMGWTATRSQPAKATFDQAIPPLLAATHNPSVSIADIHRGRVALVATYGVQSPGVPANTRSIYNIASLTKPLTAEIILRVASSGAFGLDDSMSAAWTDPDIAGDPRAVQLTPRLALSHRTGFPNWRDRKTGLKFLRSPGEAVGYSGEGYDYVARFAEKKTGKPFLTLAGERLFGPLALHDISYIGEPWFDGRIAAPTSETGEVLKPLIRTHFSAADVVYTTASDYADFMVEVLKDKGLSPAVARERDHIQVSTKADACSKTPADLCPDDIGFGLGWQILIFGDQTLFMHTGKDDGVFTFAYLNRTTGDGVVILTNSDNGAKLVTPILGLLDANPRYIEYLASQ